MSLHPDDGEPVAGAVPVAPLRHEHSSPAQNEFRYHPFVPLLLVVLASVTWFAFQCYQLMREKESVATVMANQGRPFEDSGKMRGSLDAIARETAALAARGNPSAKLVVDELARRGVTINPLPQGPAPPK